MTRASYARGYGDGSYRQGYDPRVNYGYSYSRHDGVYDPRRYDGYSPHARYDGSSDPRGYYRYGSYAGYDQGFNPVAALLGGLAGLSLAGTPVSSRSEQDNATNWAAYCSSRYRSFDPATGTFLADDGNRYYCS